MDAGTIIAIYAAVVATAVLAWNVYSFFRARRNVVQVAVAWALIGMTDGSSVEAISITATNRGDRSVRVTGAGLDLQDGSRRQLHATFPAADLPGTVAPNDSGSTYVLLDDAKGKGIDPTAPLVSWVRLATGEVVKSKPRAIMKP